jgi:ADP-ribose pyrophosphatase YjhB (NUDIX family)
MSADRVTEKNVRRAVDLLRSAVADPRKGLPENVFLLVTRLTPMVNVDLLIRDNHGGTLLTWRDDPYYEPGWHVPGGIVRFKEKMEDRVRAVARNELGATVEFESTPIAIREVIRPDQETRGHFVSLLFRCSLGSPPDEKYGYLSGRPKPGEWEWHARCPENIIQEHEMYRRFIDGP